MHNRGSAGQESRTNRVVVVAHRYDDEITASVVDALERAMPDTTVEVEHPSDGADVTDRAADAANQGVGAVVAIGGDGTVNLVAAGLVGSATALVVVPGGTVNLLAQVLGVTTIDDAVDATAGPVRRLDVGETSDSSDPGIFVLNASSGFDAAVIDDADDHGDARFGRLHFLRAGVRRLRRERPKRVTVRVDDEVLFVGRAMSVVVLNVGQRASADLDVAPSAAPDDGLLDVAVMRCATVRRTAVVLARLALGREVSTDDVLFGQGAHITATWSSPVATQRDGDSGSKSAVISHRVRPGALGVHVCNTN